MKKNKRLFLKAIVSVGLSGMVVHAAQAAGYPERPITLIVPYAGGSVTDFAARTIANKIGPRLGQPIVVDNKPGATGQIGMAAVAKAPADGYTILVGLSSTFSVSPYTFKKLPYDPQKDFVPIAQIAANWNLLVTSPKVPVKTLPELIAYAKKNPGKLNYASTGEGGHVHLSMELLKKRTGMDILHVPYKSGGQVLPDLLNGTLDVALENYITMARYIEEGRVKALGITSEKRLPAHGDIPAISESVPDYAVAGWFGVFAPAGTPKEIVTRLNTEIATALADPDVQKTLRAQGLEPVSRGPAEFQKFVRNEYKTWGAIIKEINYQPL
jgi:tripartite-type tricarboxylate transporter receptor subunit TctC